MVEDIIAEQIANIMVLPNRIAVPMIEGLNLSLLKYPPPEVSWKHLILLYNPFSLLGIIKK